MRDFLLAVPNGAALPPALAKPETPAPTAWVCSGGTCQPPTADLDTV